MVYHLRLLCYTIAQKNKMYFFIISVLLTVLFVCHATPLLEDRNCKDGSSGIHPVGELGEYFEGDMVLTTRQWQQIQIAQAGRNGLRAEDKRWPEKTVVYRIAEDVFDEEEVKIIEGAMAEIANKSCIKFRTKKDEEEHAVVIQGVGDKCYSKVGYKAEGEDDEGDQILNLGEGCVNHGIVIHEILHTLGFYHMQSTYDRDEFVTIVWENIEPCNEHNFKKYRNDTVTDFGVPYDYDSVMHYTDTAFSINGKKTIIPLQENVKIGQRKGLSERDIIKLNRMYCEDSDENTNK